MFEIYKLLLRSKVLKEAGACYRNEEMVAMKKGVGNGKQKEKMDDRSGGFPTGYAGAYDYFKERVCLLSATCGNHHRAGKVHRAWL